MDKVQLVRRSWGIWPDARTRADALRAISEGCTRETTYVAARHGEAISWACQGPVWARWQSCPFRGLCEHAPACLAAASRALVVWRARNALRHARLRTARE